MIDVSVAQSIVDRMKDIINQELNFFSVEGTIIASTDPSRIGQEEHGGAKTVLATRRPVVIEHDNQYYRAKQGINLPVMIGNNIVGVIGITGKKHEVSHYGEIIKQMTEVLILNNSAREMMFNRRNIHQNIIDYIVQSDETKQTPIEMLYGINLELARIAIVGTTNTQQTTNVADEFSTIYLELERLIGQNQQHIFEIRGNMITILLQSDSLERAYAQAETIQKSLQQTFNSSYIFGIGQVGYKESDLKESIHQAKSALHWNNISKGQSILLYRDMEYGMVLNHIPANHQEHYLTSVFNQLKPKEIAEIIKLIETYETHNGSIQRCADALFIHKNTLQYKLNRIHQLTGYNPRNIHDYFILKLASILYKISHQTI